MAEDHGHKNCGFAACRAHIASLSRRRVELLDHVAKLKKLNSDLKKVIKEMRGRNAYA